MMVVNKLYVVLCVVVVSFGALSAVEGASHQHAPAPSVDCTTLIYSMADCLSFVTNGSEVKKPEGGCCSGLKMVLKTDAECLCEAFKSSSQLGVVLNVTKAAGLPAACGVKAPSISNCGLSGAAPALAPKSSASSAPSPMSGGAPAGAPGTSPSGASGISAPTPAASSASTASISFALFVIMVVASCFSM